MFTLSQVALNPPDSPLTQVTQIGLLGGGSPGNPRMTGLEGRKPRMAGENAETGEESQRHTRAKFITVGAADTLPRVVVWIFRKCPKSLNVVLWAVLGAPCAGGLWRAAPTPTTLHKALCCTI